MPLPKIPKINRPNDGSISHDEIGMFLREPYTGKLDILFYIATNAFVDCEGNERELGV